MNAISRALHEPTQRRVTRQRIIIRRIFEQHTRPLSAYDVHQFASRLMPRIGTATVYRNLSQMVESGELMTCELPGRALLYHRPEFEGHPLFLDIRSDHVAFLPPDCLRLEWQGKPAQRINAVQVIVYGSNP